MTITNTSAAICRSLLNDEFKPKENLELASFLGDTDLESVVMRYGHGDCHVWSIALAQAAFNDEIFGIDSFVMQIGSTIIHSGIYFNGVFLDSTGVHTEAELISHWAFHGTVEINMYDLDDLFYLVSPDEDEIAEAHDNIEFWYKKTEAYLKQ